MAYGLPIVFSGLPVGLNPMAYFDEDFQYLLDLIIATGGFEPEVVDSATINVQPTWSALVIKRTIAGATTVNLPAVSTRNGLALPISDWNGNAGDITLLPNTSGPGLPETIMGLSTAVLISNGQGAGTAASITLYPSIQLNGWYIA